ncbi:MAG: sulfite exporter TauE/SafE family protein [Actinobacteria bacterium]|nr:sulfite exporter TauE/SafE family protein [Actinomycetota bacterium]
MPVGPGDLAAALAVTAVAAGLQGTIGFGFALVCVPVLSVLDPALAPVPQLLLILPLTLAVAWRDRKEADLRAVPWVTAGRLPGAAIGLLLLASFDERTLGIAVAVTVLAGVALVSTGLQVPRNPGTSFTAGVLSGVMGLVASVGGPPLALLYRSARGATVRASLGVVFAIGVVISITARAAGGQMAGDDLRVALLLSPALVVGLWVGRRLAPRVEGALLRGAILAVSAAAGVLLLVRSL